MPTYIGLRVMPFAPVVTKLEVRSGRNGSTVVPLRRNRLADAPASTDDATAKAAAVAERDLLTSTVGARTR